MSVALRRGTPLSRRALRRLATKRRTGRYHGVENATAGGGFEAILDVKKQRRKERAA